MATCFQPLQGRLIAHKQINRRTAPIRACPATPAYQPEPQSPQQPNLLQAAACHLANAYKATSRAVATWAREQAVAVKKFAEKEENQRAGKQWWKQARTLALVLPFASVTGGQDTFVLLSKSVCQFVKLYLLLLFARVILSWFPTFDWDRQPWMALRQVTDPYLNLFQGLVPPLLGAIDLTPLVGFMLLQLLAGYLETSTEDDIDAYW